MTTPPPIGTPRTDDQIGHGSATMTIIPINFARTLERELTAAKSRAVDDAKRIAELEHTLTGISDARLEAFKRIHAGREANLRTEITALQASLAQRDSAIDNMRDAINAALHTGEGCALDSNQRLNLLQCVPHSATSSTGEGE